MSKFNLHILGGMIFMLFSLTAFAKEDTLIYFQKIKNERTIGLKLPLKCRIYFSKDNKRFGQITDYEQELIYFKYKDYDSSDVDAIMEVDSLTRREKYDRLDSLIQESVVTIAIPIDSIFKISILSGSDILSRELSMLGSSILFLGSLSALLVDASQNVGQGMRWWNWIEVGSAASGVALMTLLMKRNIHLSEWKLIPPPD